MHWGVRTAEHCFSAPVGKAILRVTVGEGYAAGIHKLILPCSAASSTPAGSGAQARLQSRKQHAAVRANMTHAALPCLLCNTRLPLSPPWHTRGRRPALHWHKTQ